MDLYYKIMQNSHYVGDYHYDRHVIPSGVPAIVPPDLFVQAQEMLANSGFTDIGGLMSLNKTSGTAAEDYLHSIDYQG